MTQFFECYMQLVELDNATECEREPMLNESSTPEATVVSSPPPSYTSTENQDDTIPG